MVEISFRIPLVQVQDYEEYIAVSIPTAENIAALFENGDIVQRIVATGRRRSILRYRSIDSSRSDVPPATKESKTNTINDRAKNE